MKITDFIDYIITFDNVNDILDNCKTQSFKNKTFFERLFNIVIKSKFYIVIKFGFVMFFLIIILTI